MTQQSIAIDDLRASALDNADDLGNGCEMCGATIFEDCNCYHVAHMKEFEATLRELRAKARAEVKAEQAAHYEAERECGLMAQGGASVSQTLQTKPRNRMAKPRIVESRADRAARLRPRFVGYGPDDLLLFEVPSSKPPHLPYAVSIASISGETRCTCKDAECRPELTCKHALAALKACEAFGLVAPRVQLNDAAASSAWNADEWAILETLSEVQS